MGKTIEVDEDVLRAAIETEVVRSFGLDDVLADFEAPTIARNVLRRLRREPNQEPEDAAGPSGLAVVGRRGRP